MPKKEICVNTNVEVPISKIFNHSTPEQVYEKLIDIAERSVERFKDKYGEPSRFLFKTKSYLHHEAIEIYFMRSETDEEYEERKIQHKYNRKLDKLKMKYNDFDINHKKRKKLKDKVTNAVKENMIKSENNDGN
jgi:hypothetical protein